MIDIKKNIKTHGWTISALAEKLGVSQPSLSQQIANGTPSLVRLQEIADVMGITVSELVRCAESTSEAVCPHCGKPIKVIIQ